MCTSALRILSWQISDERKKEMIDVQNGKDE